MLAFGFIMFVASIPWLAVGEVIDLSWEFDNETVYWPGHRRFEFTKQIATDSNRGYWYAASEFCTAEHGGTHFDSPYHFHKDGWKVSEVPVSRLYAKGALISLRSGNEASNSDTSLTVNDLQHWEERNGPFENGSVLLVDFGRSAYWNTNKTKYLELDLNDTMHFPGISREAAQWIADSKKFYGVGLDTPSVDPGDSTDMMAHRILSEHKLYILENVNLKNQTKLPEKGFDLIIAPMKIKGGTGAPVRIFAKIK